ncbi:DUF3046 domain-containing protein [Streptomyces boluensis]|uniref:DUF3046 domain-containing protein n=1 Tax=Streptomyces boluensis TaxID=1775135 RepID=A0A964XM83_9ACTN|nr:DUF3046 domain-containing protein [Streptomyces boluensis]NBE54130.1 DUF3046 domain-containing protein [Streptomyces boluensis]
MRLTVFWQRMEEHFGASYADSFARDHVMSELGGRTVHQALDAGWETREVWRAVCGAMGVPADKRGALPDDKR